MLHPDIKVYDSPTHEKGLVATKFIPKNTVVWKLDSNEKKLTLEELEKLPEDRKRLAYQYKDTYIIVTDTSEYMNHSCDPNTWWLDDETLTAIGDIKEGEEVTYDYATAEVDVGFRSKWECHCGSLNCRKIITSTDCLLKDFQDRYQDHLPSWTLEFIQKHRQ